MTQGIKTLLLVAASFVTVLCAVIALLFVLDIGTTEALKETLTKGLSVVGVLVGAGLIFVLLSQKTGSP